MKLIMINYGASDIYRRIYFKEEKTEELVPAVVECHLKYPDYVLLLTENIKNLHK